MRSGRVEPLPESRGHTPVYKLHRYFARRPHNQFHAIIEQCVPQDGVVLDPMAGGGVTLIEGLTAQRHVISVDVNPIAALVQLGQATEFDPHTVRGVVDAVVAEIPADVRTWYDAECERCKSQGRVRWFVCAYRVACSICGHATELSNDRRAVNANGRPVAGTYACDSCGEAFRAVDAERDGHVSLTARVKCLACGHQTMREPSDRERALVSQIAAGEGRIVERYGLELPTEEIPPHWDRQHEDALARKGFRRFTDLFTPRNRIIMAFLLAGLRRRRHELAETDYVGALTACSSLIRYVNNMTVSTPGWMDGRPVAWAKHAYWMPNEFVECNPFEYLENRLKALELGASDRRRRFREKRRGARPRDVIERTADYCILRASSTRLDLPDSSVDAVVTDPPFGSNVQYGELTTLWSVWLGELNPFAQSDFMDDEVLVTRRTRIRPKTMEQYREGLTAIFAECHRVLRDEGVFAFTFNNKDPDAWHAVMRAAFDAGFSLDPEDIAYQREIHAYRDTAHLRFKGELQGDTLYAFRKEAPPKFQVVVDVAEWEAAAESRLQQAEHDRQLLHERITLHVEALRHAAAAIQQGRDADALEQMEASRRVVGAARA